MPDTIETLRARAAPRTRGVYRSFLITWTRRDIHHRTRSPRVEFIVLRALRVCNIRSRGRGATALDRRDIFRR